MRETRRKGSLRTPPLKTEFWFVQNMSLRWCCSLFTEGMAKDWIQAQPFEASDFCRCKAKPRQKVILLFLRFWNHNSKSNFKKEPLVFPSLLLRTRNELRILLHSQLSLSLSNVLCDWIYDFNKYILFWFLFDGRYENTFAGWIFKVMPYLKVKSILH